ncbi:hypothetical protein CJO88_16650 [Ralstonia solanacearum]|nr:hypothetical protein CJO88_16650 [Ralstonia solanacearum]
MGYRPFLRARDVSGQRSIASDNPFSKHGNGSVPAHASQEQRIQLACFFCPHVLDIRSQYYYCDDEMDQRILNGYIPVRNKLPTLDLMLTINCPSTKRIVYHAINVKPVGRQKDKDVQSRITRDRKFCDRLGFTYEMLSKEDFPDVELGNHWALFGQLRYQNLDAIHVPAKEFARFLNGSTASGTADRVLGMVGRRYGVNLADSYRLFAAATFFGFVRLDMNYVFASDMELMLLRGRDV